MCVCVYMYVYLICSPDAPVNCYQEVITYIAIVIVCLSIHDL